MSHLPHLTHCICPCLVLLLMNGYFATSHLCVDITLHGSTTESELVSGQISSSHLPIESMIHLASDLKDIFCSIVLPSCTAHTCAIMEVLRESRHARVAHSRQSVFPVPVGLSSKAFVPYR